MLAALELGGSAPRVRERGRLVAVLDLLRAYPPVDVVFLLGLEEGSLPRSRTSRSSTTTAGGARRTARAPRPGEPRPLPLLYGLHPRHAAAVPRARSGNRRRAARAGPFGRSRRRLCAQDVAHAKMLRPLSALTWPPTPRPRARTPARSRSRRRRWRRGTRTRGRERLGPPARSCALGVRDEATNEAIRASFGRARRSRRPSRGRGLLVGVAVRTRDRRARSTPSSTRCCADQSRTRRSIASTSGLPKEVGYDRVAGTSSGRPCLPDDGMRGGVQLERRICRRPSSRRRSGVTSRASSATRRSRRSR